MTDLRVLLVNPPVLGVLEPWYDTPAFGRVGLACLAGYLRNFKGFKVKIIDAKFERLNFDEVCEQVMQWQPDVVGLTAFTNEIKPAAYQAARIKQLHPQAITVIGGVHVTALPQQTLEEFGSFDIGVNGEGEVTFYELCDAIKNGTALHKVPGLILREGGEVVLSGIRPRILDETILPMPAWDLLPQAEEYYIQSIRGCPLNCVFCMNHNGRVARQRTVDSVIDEMEYIIEHFHPKRITFCDELFSVDAIRTHRLLDAMIEHQIGERVSWDVQTHVRYVDYEMLRKMKKANITRIEMGVETGDEESLKKMGKGTNLMMIKKAFDTAREVGVPTGSFFLLGQPYESVSSIQKTIDLAVKLNPDLPMFGIMVPFPGTEVSRLAANGEGGYEMISTNWDEFNKQLGGALKFANLSRTQIEWFQVFGYFKVFLSNGRLIDLIKFVFTYGIGGWSLLRKLFTRGNGITSLFKLPPDYEELIGAKRSITMEDLINARKEWKEVQKRELIASKQQFAKIS